MTFVKLRFAAATATLVLVGCGSSKQPAALKAIAYTKFLRDNKQEVWIARPDGSHKRRLVSGRLPALSPDGRWVAFEGACDPIRGCGELLVVPSAGGKTRRLASGAFRIGWSPDSQRLLAYQPVSENGGLLLVIDRDGGRRIVIAKGGLNGWSFSPNGRQVAFSKKRGAKDDIHVVDADGGEAHRVTRDGSSAFPVWTRRGIVFSRLISPPGIANFGWGAHELWRIDADGSNRRSLSGPLPARILGQGISGLEPVGWSNGALLAGLSNEFGSPPYAVDPRTKTVRQIGRFGFRGVADGLSRDGREVLVETGSVEVDRAQRIEVVPFAGGKGRVIARFAGEASWNL
jgi:Tol biopolymer transport system component